MRKVRFAMQGGIWPLRWSDSRSSATTRDVCLLLQVTPDQVQNCWSESSTFHEAGSPAEVLRWILRQQRVWKSVLASLWRALAPTIEHVRRDERTRIRGSDGEKQEVPIGDICFLSYKKAYVPVALVDR